MLLACRDGEATLPETLQSLLAQTIPLDIVVTDDHSIDSTPQIIEKYGVQSIRCLKREPKNYSRVPHLFSLAYRKAPPSDYYMISGDDQIYPPNYVESVIAHMEKDGVQIGSGHNAHLSYLRTQAPTGSGRIISSKLMKEFMPLLGSTTWDSWILLRAKQLGYKCKAYPIPKIHMKERRTRINWGFGSHLSGTPIIFTLMRVPRQIIRTRRILFPLSILVGQITYTIMRVPKLNYAKYNNHRKRLQITGTIKGSARAVLKKIGHLKLKP